MKVYLTAPNVARPGRCPTGAADACSAIVGGEQSAGDEIQSIGGSIEFHVCPSRVSAHWSVSVQVEVPHHEWIHGPSRGSSSLPHLAGRSVIRCRHLRGCHAIPES